MPHLRLGYIVNLTIPVDVEVQGRIANSRLSLLLIPHSNLSVWVFVSKWRILLVPKEL
jgi:hypothetical protein